jgi:hypothetical protein
VRFRLPFIAVAALAISLPLVAQAPSTGPTVEVDFTNSALSPSHWTLTIHPDSSAHFRSQHATPPSGAPPGDPSDIDRDLRLSAPFTARVFEAARSHKLFNLECESKLKVAFQGEKTLSYTGPEGHGSCTFNYAKDKEIQALSDSMVDVAATIAEGARLVKLEQHDRLGLYNEMEMFTAGAADGRFEQMSAIREILQRLAADDALMERVRKRARELLVQADAENQK